jgi:hypothetical protein
VPPVAAVPAREPPSAGLLCPPAPSRRLCAAAAGRCLCLRCHCYCHCHGHGHRLDYGLWPRPVLPRRTGLPLPSTSPCALLAAGRPYAAGHSSTPANRAQLQACFLFGQDDGKSDNKENYRVGPPILVRRFESPLKPSHKGSPPPNRRAWRHPHEPSWGVLPIPL